MAHSTSDGSELESGAAGASARREGQRRKASRERRVRDKHPHIGGAILALRSEPQHERAWAYGADGEERVARALAKYLNNEVVVLHDRRVPGSRANIDHIVIAPSGVWVIDTKRYKGKVAVIKPLFEEAKLTIDGRNKSGLVTGLRKQVGLVEGAVDRSIPVHGALCFVDAQLPLLGTLTFGGFPMLHARSLARRISRPGPLAGSDLPLIADALAARFPSA